MTNMTSNNPSTVCTPQTISYTIALSIFMGYLVLAVWFPLGYIWATYENLYGEWLQFGLWVLTAIIACACMLRRQHYRFFFCALSLAAFYVAMEEISWGQQLFNWESPEFFLNNSLQHETNIHNLLTGPVSTPLKDAIRLALGTGLWAYGIVYPYMLRKDMALARTAERFGIAPPPEFTWLFFFFGGLFEFGLFDFNEAEVAEVMVGAGMLMLTLSYWHRVMPSGSTTANSLAAFSMAQTFLIGVLISGTMTSVTLARQSTRDIALQRVERGIESFAGRYAAYGRWETSIELNRRFLTYWPNNVSVMREQYQYYLNLGQTENAARSLMEALVVDEDRLAVDPEDEAAHRSMSRTLTLQGNIEAANVHAERALALASSRTKSDPDDASAWFSLSISQSLLGQNDAALESISNAYRLEPESLTYRKLFLRLQKPETG